VAADGAISASAKEYGAAERALKEAARIAPTSVEPPLALGSLYRVQGKKAEAEAQYRQAIALKPDNMGLHLTLAQFLVTAGELTRAGAAYQDAIKTFPGQAGPRLAYAQFLIATRDLDKAVDQYRAVLKDHPRDIVTRKQLAGLLLDQGRPDDARPLVADLTSDRRGDPDVLYLSARLFIVDREFDSAVTALQEALEADPDHAKAHQTLGLVDRDAATFSRLHSSYAR
jgi:tetratricopeptide (TPR) repeat protein